MADTTAATAATAADLEFNLKDYINNEDTGLLAAIKKYFDLYDTFHAKKAEKNGLQDGKLILPDHPPIGASELRTMKAHIIKNVQNLPKVVASSERAKKAQKSAARRANMTGDRQQPPSIFTGELVAFFKAADLGTKPDGTGRLQDMPEMAAFFTNGVANLTFGVSLLNVWGYRNKLNGDHHRVILDANAKKYLKTAIEKLRLKKTANIAKAEESGDAKAIENAKKELARFNEGEIQNKDYMTLFIEYRNPEQPAKETLLKFSDVVSSMSDITKARNEHYKAELQAKHPKEKAAAPVKKTASTPVRKSASPAPVKKTEAVAPLPTPAPLPVAPAATGKKSKK